MNSTGMPGRPGLGNVAAVDCGTLSTRMLIAAPGGDTLDRRMRVTRLGEGVDAARALAPAAMSRTLAVLEGYRRAMDDHAVVAARMVGTSALRDAANRDELTQAARDVIGVPLELLSGTEEASLSLQGALPGLDAVRGPWLMVDIGGGSTELAVADPAAAEPTAANPAAAEPTAAEPTAAVSLDLGCVRVSERFFHHDPPTPDELETARAWLAGQLEGTPPQLRSARSLVGLAGTVSALAAWDQGLLSYERDKVHHYRLSLSAVRRAWEQLPAFTADQRAGLAGIEPARAPLIIGGVAVLLAVMEHFGFDYCLVSEADILDGLALSLLAHQGE